jgi:MFS family permease
MACLALGGIGAGGINSLAGATLPSELVPHRRGASIGVCNLFAATLGITLSPVIGGVLADHFGLLVPVTLAGLVWLVVIGMFLPIPETAPKVLARQGLAPAAPQESVAA